MNEISPHSSRYLAKPDFEKAYEKVVLSSIFFEQDLYYVQQKPRYLDILRYICQLSLPRAARILETGGGQIALLTKEI